MVLFGGDGKPYGDDVANDTCGWTEIAGLKDILRSRPDPDDPVEPRDIPFQLFVNRFKSSSPDWESFLHDPFRQMLKDPGDLRNMPDWPDFPGDGDDPRGNNNPMRPLRDEPRWQVSTFVTNHHRPLNRVHASVIAIVSPGGSIHLMIFKDADQTR